MSNEQVKPNISKSELLIFTTEPAPPPDFPISVLVNFIFLAALGKNHGDTELAVALKALRGAPIFPLITSLPDLTSYPPPPAVPYPRDFVFSA